jgi:hypothetical protein
MSEKRYFFGTEKDRRRRICAPFADRNSTLARYHYGYVKEY